MKPHKGMIVGHKERHTTQEYGPNLGYLVIGRFKNHPHFRGQYGHTSLVVSERLCTEHDEDETKFNVWEIETLNSRYTFLEHK